MFLEMLIESTEMAYESSALYSSAMEPMYLPTIRLDQVLVSHSAQHLFSDV